MGTVLEQVFGFSEFRSGQEDIAKALVDGRNVLAIMPTGAGKSLCYQIAALMRPGVTIVVSPLLALMNDQVASLKA
ncbi:MAG: DEAD/DEAH box helicase, partial [Sphingomonadales bacterium]|nr:DEAD/DEAH box helicase [Sphingomonadales bacterium]